MTGTQTGAPMLGAFITAISDLTGELRDMDRGNDPTNIALAALRGARSFRPMYLEATEADAYIDLMTRFGLTAQRIGPDYEDEEPGVMYAEVQVTW